MFVNLAVKEIIVNVPECCYFKQNDQVVINAEYKNSFCPHLSINMHHILV